ncbi:hypothetical protein SNE40_013169 [Patella caerulea]|uniref:Uncharacterized protein n=1 Tax=Patella caerulea TaxID=87958 RepID=A0AAN8JMM5_PATCE
MESILLNFQNGGVKQSFDDSTPGTSRNEEIRKPCDAQAEKMGEVLQSSSKRVALNKWVIVAFDDDWYPGIVREIKSKNELVVDFGKRCRSLGEFNWPNGKDAQLVEHKFILLADFQPTSNTREESGLFRMHIKLYKYMKTMLHFFSVKQTLVEFKFFSGTYSC